MLLGLPEPLPSLVAKRFAAAKEAGALIFSATHLAVLPAAGVHVCTKLPLYLFFVNGR
jgi:ATP adenylyltransferase